MIVIRVQLRPKMKKYTQILFSALFAISLIIACSTNPASEVSDIKKTVVDVEGDEFVSVATLSIEGMSCAQACGATIKKAVDKVDGVISSKVDFDSEKLVDKCVVKFDPHKTNDDELIAAVSGLMDGRYLVKEVQVVNTVKGEERDNDVDTEDEASIDIREFGLPNLFDLLDNLIQ